MNRLCSVALLAVTLAQPVAASAAVSPLPAPPVEANAAASQIFDALMAVSRVASSNPGAAQTAGVTYTAAVTQYNSGDVERARRSAIDAVMQSGAPLYPQPSNAPPNISPPAPAHMPPVRTIMQAEMEERLAIARRALVQCGPTTGSTFIGARATYETAVHDLMAQHLDALNADTKSIVDACATPNG